MVSVFRVVVRFAPPWMAAGFRVDWDRALLMLRNCLVWESILMLAMLPASS